MLRMCQGRLGFRACALQPSVLVPLTQTLSVTLAGTRVGADFNPLACFSIYTARIPSNLLYS